MVPYKPQSCFSTSAASTSHIWTCTSLGSLNSLVSFCFCSQTQAMLEWYRTIRSPCIWPNTSLFKKESLENFSKKLIVLWTFPLLESCLPFRLIFELITTMLHHHLHLPAHQITAGHIACIFSSLATSPSGPFSSPPPYSLFNLSTMILLHCWLNKQLLTIKIQN